jgi:very-short-patch-repair endonuclease
VPLRWHYRSRDDSLIAFSNHHFYRNRLVTFPNAERAELDLGPRFVFCTEGVYDRSRSRTNRNEARTVAVLLGELHKRYPGDSLGVVALSQAQQEAIQDAIEDLARGDSMYERLLSAAEEPEGLFVKNLETVQGDERDTIILSVGYGRDETGRLHTNFGPLNREGGERRLNVAVSRARNRVVVVSSIKADDLPRTGSRGIVLLREYLEYAEKGPGTLASAADGGLDEGESPFEEAVRAALVDRGLDMRAQVGCGAYRVDLAVVDPEHPGRYLLGIECDGATYHSARTARDRDRLRQQVLERLGWRTVRIWSTDWVKDPERQIARVVEEVAKARALPDARPEGIPAVSAEGVAGAEPAIGPDPPAPEEARADAEPGAAVAEAAPHVYRAAELGVVGTSDSFYALAEARDPSFLSLVVKVVEVESPVHKDVVARRLTTAFGMKHCGAKIQRLVTQSIVALSRRGTLRIQRGFAWAREPRPVVVRTNAGASEVRSPEHIAAEEVREAVLKVVSESFGVGRDECAAGVARAFGFERAGARIREWALKAVDAAVREGAVEVVGEGTLVLPRR